MKLLKKFLLLLIAFGLFVIIKGNGIAITSVCEKIQSDISQIALGLSIDMADCTCVKAAQLCDDLKTPPYQFGDICAKAKVALVPAQLQALVQCNCNTFAKTCAFFDELNLNYSRSLAKPSSMHLSPSSTPISVPMTKQTMTPEPSVVMQSSSVMQQTTSMSQGTNKPTTSTGMVMQVTSTPLIALPSAIQPNLSSSMAMSSTSSVNSTTGGSAGNAKNLKALHLLISGLLSFALFVVIL